MKPIIVKSKGQTDRRILGLSYKDFEEEFGFKPDDKIEQAYFADTGERLVNPEHRAKRVKLDKQKKRLRSE